MKKSLKRLVLHRETLTNLDQPSLGAVLGGNSGSCLQSCVYACLTRELSGCRPCEAQ